MSVPPCNDTASGVSAVVERNLATLIERERADRARRTLQERMADRIAAFTGSFPFVYIHLILFSGWILWNTVPHPFPRFDPSLVVLAMVASVEAIFLSTFVLINQNRMARDAERRAQLDLQISLLSEHEITRVIRLVGRIAERLGIESVRDAELAELEQDVAPERVMDKIDEHESKSPP